MRTGQMWLHKDRTKITVLINTYTSMYQATVYNLTTGRRTTVSIRPATLLKNYHAISN
ncbi:hypothetical protein AB0B15_03415 [Streptomyces sp. NPDC045456]|uniref:hypothetical protein n=1 Tax=Streptomyces sp. NPDC045456 TaxID=3155254 RepID=UPI0033D06FD5